MVVHDQDSRFIDCLAVKQAHPNNSTTVLASIVDDWRYQ